MKTVYMVYAILVLKFSVIRVDEDLDGRCVQWIAHDDPQDGAAGTNLGCIWSNYHKTPQNAVWALRELRKERGK